ncbi:prepilin-type N-terminal cleavage/methylation domain-containing protein [Patescibacteria group bacterium]|nr:prepilin-type N-terminal cleavage/methylation domain-containing protein [Patescibacteria group bacterium]
MKATKKAFTLIEMLIVIVIIGILAAALVPRLISVQGRARDTKRKADISQIGSALAIYKTDNSTFPATSGSSFAVLAPLLSGYLTTTPTDPVSTASVSPDIAGGYSTGYGYISIVRNGVASNAAVLMAQTESDGASSNFMSSGTLISHSADAGALDSLLAGCNGRVAKSTAWSWTAGSCTGPMTGMRYYYTE